MLSKELTRPLTMIKVQRMRNLAISALRLAGRTDITEATRWACRNTTRPFTILNLTE